MKIRIKRKFVANEPPLQYRVTPFSSVGIYPRGVFCFPSGAFYADNDIVFAVTHCPGWSESLPYSEVDWLNPELVRLLGALMLCEKFTERRCWFYPHVHADVALANKSLDLTDEDCIGAIRAAVANEALFSSSSHAHAKIPGVISEGYLFAPTDLNIELLPQYWELISTSNLVLMRGIQSLVKCDMLAMHPQFQEEAALQTFIALDASFEMVLRHLRAQGHRSPSAADAAKWFHDTFDGPMGLAAPHDGMYFSDFYQQRIRTFHPGNRFGDTPFAAISISDRIHLRQALPGVFAYLISGTHSPDWLERVAEAQNGGR